MVIKFPRTGITNWIHLEKLAVPQEIRIFHHFMEPERSSWQSQEQTSFPCPEIHNPDHSLPFISLESMLLLFCHINLGPPLSSSGQSFWLQIERSRVRFPALPDFLSCSGSGTGSAQPREPREVN